MTNSRGPSVQRKIKSAPDPVDKLITSVDCHSPAEQYGNGQALNVVVISEPEGNGVVDHDPIRTEDGAPFLSIRKYVSTKMMINWTINSQVTYPGTAVDAEFQATGLDSSDERFGLRKVPGGAVVPLQ
jgi:hypothetical protein